MATFTEDQAELDAPKSSIRVHIADIKLDPSSNNDDNIYLEAAVQLVWPFSSVTSQLSLLLIEKDVSFRDIAAQLKVTFHDACAKEVAQSKIGIGDIVRLRLKGSTIEHEHEGLSTPGKKTGFDLHYRKSVHIQAREKSMHIKPHNIDSLQATTYDGQTKLIDFNAPNPPVALNSEHSTPVTPLRSGSVDLSVLKNKYSTNSTPVWKKALRLPSNSFPGSGSLVEPFAEDDGYIQGYGRKRTKFARRSNQWRLADGLEEMEDLGNEDRVSTQPTEQLLPSRSVDLVEVFIPTSTRSREVQTSLLNDQISEHAQGRREATDLEAAPSTPQDSAIHSGTEKPTATDQAQPMNTRSRPASLEIQMPVDRQSHDDPTIPIILSSSPVIPVPSNVPLADPNSDQAHAFSSYPQVTLELDESDPGNDQPPSEASRTRLQEPSYFLQATETPALMRPAPLSATDVVETFPPDTFPSIVPEPAEIDLDRLQAEIDLDNIDFMPRAQSQTVEVEDMYGPPNDREIGMELQHIEEIRSRMSSMEPQAILKHQQFTPSTSAYPASNDNEGRIRENGFGLTNEIHDPMSQQASFAPSISDEAFFQPYPTHFEDPITHDARQEIAISDNQEENESSTSPSRSNLNQLQFLDGVVDIQAFSGTSPRDAYVSLTDNLGLVQTGFILPLHEPPTLPDDTIPITPSLEDEVEVAQNEDIPPSAPEHPQSSSQVDQPLEPDDGRSASPLTQHIMHEDHVESPSRAVTNVFTPDATQKTVAHANDDTTAGSYAGGELPPTPVESQAEMGHMNQVEPSVEVNHTQMVQTESMPVQPTPSKDLHQREYIGGIASPYFTPRLATATPDTTMQSMKVPGSSRMRLRSSSPADFPVDHLESERLAAVATSTNEITNRSGDEHYLSSTQKGMITPLEYYANLSALGEHYNQLVDVMAICTTQSVPPERAKSGPKDFFTTIHLADPSIEGSDATITVQIFRPHRKALPVVSPGDALLLRRFRVQTQSHKPMLLSTDESAWGVYKSIGSSDRGEDKETTVIEHPIVAGPPIEYGPFERDNVSRLLKWWRTNGRDIRSETALQTSPTTAVSTTGPKRLKKPPPLPIDLRRSPRRPNNLANVDTSQSETSPTFLPESPTRSIPSQVSPHSPISTRSLRSQISPTRSEANIPKRQPPMTPRNKSRPKSTPRPEQSSTPTRLNLQYSDNSTPLVTNKTSRNFSSSNSVTSSVTQTSASSRKRRLERRSTSLVHQLRDGTEWVDIEQEEVYSVTETESEEEDENNGEGGHSAEATEEAAKHEKQSVQEQDDPLSLDAVDDHDANAPNLDPGKIAIPAQPPTPSGLKNTARTRSQKSPALPRKHPSTTGDSPIRRTRNRPNSIDIDQAKTSSPPSIATAKSDMSPPPLHSPTSDKGQGQLSTTSRTTRSQAAIQRGAN